jgi:hypothetical protein
MIYIYDIYINIYVYSHTHTHARTDTRTHAHTHTHTHTRREGEVIGSRARVISARAILLLLLLLLLRHHHLIAKAHMRARCSCGLRVLLAAPAAHPASIFVLLTFVAVKQAKIGTCCHRCCGRVSLLSTRSTLCSVARTRPLTTFACACCCCAC